MCHTSKTSLTLFTQDTTYQVSFFDQRTRKIQCHRASSIPGLYFVVPCVLLLFGCKDMPEKQPISSVVCGIIQACHAYFHINYGGYPDFRDEWFAPTESISTGVERFSHVPAFDGPFSSLDSYGLRAVPNEQQKIPIRDVFLSWIAYFSCQDSQPKVRE